MAWRALSFSAVALYVAMRRKLLSTNNGNIEATIATMRHAGFGSPTTLSKGLRELQVVGLIAMTRQGGIASGTKLCSLYRFTDVEVFSMPKVGVVQCAPSNEWRHFKTLVEAERAIATSHDDAKRPVGKNASRIQKPYRFDTDSVVKDEFLDTDSDQERIQLDQKMNKRDERETAPSSHEH
ncbi:hypothetical protein WAE61_09020 [Comamonadaceae bacterium PP-2]